MRRLMMGMLMGAVLTLGVQQWMLPGAGRPGPEGLIPVEEAEFPEGGEEQDHRQLSHPDLLALFPGHVTTQGPADRPWIALTFDDGPDDRFTPAILDVLAELEVPATFFVNGTQILRYPDVLFRMLREGHAVGHHGYRHVDFSGRTAADIRDDLARNRALLELAGSEYGNLFRPPYGALDPASTRTIVEEGYHIVLWSIDPNDWRQLPGDIIAEYVLERARPGSIVLLHSAGTDDLSGTVEALPVIVEELRRRGFEFVTVPQMLAALQTN